MNTATIKYYKIASSKEDFKGSVHTVQEEIVGFFSAQSKGKSKHKTKEEPDESSKKKTKRDTNCTSPPFIKYYKNENGNKYKLGDKKEHNGLIFYYCDAPTYRDRVKWHTHTHEKCRV